MEKYSIVREPSPKPNESFVAYKLIDNYNDTVLAITWVSGRTGYRTTSSLSERYIEVPESIKAIFESRPFELMD